MKKAAYNSIEDQRKTETSKISSREWNRIVNILKEQANYNATTIEQLFRDLGYMDKDIKLKVKELEDGIINWDEVVEEIKSHDEIHVGREEPSGREKIWFELKGE